jgi:putative PEP-CTERM system TPR-repeat lipoprotein
VNPNARGLALYFFIAAALLGGCGGETPEALLGSAKHYLAEKNTRAAVIQLKSALQRQPELAEARFLLGRTLLDDGDAVAAEVELRKALDLKHPEVAVLPPLAAAMVLGGKGQRVIQDYAKVDLADPAAAAALKTALAKAYAQRDNKVMMQGALDQALGAVPGFGPALLMQARHKAAEHEFDLAFALIEKVLVQDPGGYEALQLKGDLLFFAKADAVNALAAQRLALVQRKDWLPAHASILDILLSRGDLPAAKTQLDELKKVLPNHPQTKYFEAQLAFLSQDYKTANEFAQLLLKSTPDNVKVLLLAGSIELQGGSLAQAESLVAKALQRSPDIAMTRRLLTRIYLRSGQEAKAREALAPLLERPEADAETLNLAGHAALQTGDAKNAEAYFTRAAKLAPHDMRSRTALALARFSNGNDDLGLAQLQEIASSDKGTIADMAIISVRLRQQDYDAALKAIDSMEQKQPNRPFAAQLRGQIEMARKNYAAARQNFSKAVSVDPQYFPAVASLASLDLRDKKPDEARKHFERLLTIDPRNVRALLAIAELRAGAGASNEEVGGLLANAINLNPTVAAPRLLLIELNLRTQHNKVALGLAQEAVAALPESPELLEALGRSQMATENTDQAINSFNKLAALQRRSPQPHLRLAAAYMRLKKPAAARESLHRALEITPKFLPAQRGLVMLELAAGRPDQAKAVARTVKSERPDQNVGDLFIGDIEAFQSNWDAAAAAYRAGLKRGASTELATKLHSVLITAQKHADAETFAARWLKEHPQDATFLIHLAEQALAKLDFATAEKRYFAVVSLQPENALALNNLAWVTNKLKRPGAAAYAEKANALRPDQPAFLDTLGTILSDAGQLRKALELQKKAVALAPESASIRLNLAKLYLQAGDKALARSELERLSKLGDKFADQAEVGQLLSAL